jgi:methylmalonyl-CoA/ethylmalonyl-CoA epimerase
MSIHHIGYAVKDIEKAYDIFSLLGYKKLYGTVGGGVADYDRNVRILMLENESVRVELVSFLDHNKSSPIDFLFKSKFSFPGNGIPYHICYNVNDIVDTICFLKTKKFLVIQPPCRAVALDNKTVAFLFHKDIGIIELYEEKFYE